jgi:hypothetical protein
MSNGTDFTRVLHAQEQNEERLLDLPAVIGVASGRRVRRGRLTRELCVQVFVERKRPLESIGAAERVPDAVAAAAEAAETVGTDVIEITRPQEHQVDNTRYRPVPGGCSIGPESSVSAGTLGGWACDNTDDTIVLLTNNHVISALDNMPAARRVVQPGRLDGGVLPGDVIGTLKRHVALATVANPPGAPLPNVTAVDAAIGTIDVDRTDDVLQIAPAIYELQAPAVNMDVQKRGRTTRLTNNGRVFSVNGTFTINYRNGTRLGRVANTFLIRSTDGNVFSRPGDSGSLIFNQRDGELSGTRPVVGLLYAGGSFGDGTPYTLACDINTVFGAMNLTTICTCIVRAIIRAVFGSQAVDEATTHRLARRKERQLRSLRTRVVRQTRFGKAFDDFVSAEAATLAKELMDDDVAFGLAVRALEPWLTKRTTLDMLETEIDPETVATVRRLTKILGTKAKNVQPQLTATSAAVEQAQGKTVDDLLRKGVFKRT